MNYDIKSLLSKYISNLCTAAELEKVKAILQSGLYEEEWSAVLEEESARELAPHADTIADPVSVNFDAEKVLNRINQTTTSGTTRPGTLILQTKIPAYKLSIGIAAALLISLAAGYLLYNPAFREIAPVHLLSLATKPGEHKIVTLTDGSIITLNNRSEIRYADQFAANRREVYLSGEAFFEVKHETKRPFIVHAGKLKVQVLGTSFNVKAYQSDIRTTVGVATGKVGVNGADTRTYMLTPGKVLSCNKKGGMVEESTVGLEEISGWQQGILVFHQDTFRDIVPEIERWYNVSLRVKRTILMKKRITASFSKKSLSEVLEILSKTADFTYKINKNEVYIN